VRNRTKEALLVGGCTSKKRLKGSGNMKVRTSSASEVKDAIVIRSSRKVCLFILRPSRTDYRALRTITALKNAGFEVSVVDIECERSTPHEEMRDGVRWHHLIIPDWRSSRGFQLFFFFVAIKTFFLSLSILLKSQVDMYHAVDLTALPICYIVTRLRCKPLIFEAYELDVPAPETDIAFWRWLGPLLLGIILPHCTKIITVSPLCAEELCRHFRIREVAVVRSIPAYCTVQKSNLLRQHLKLREDTRIALYQGILQRNRGLDKLIRAAAFLDDNIVIVIMGAGNSKELEALTISEKVTERVKIIQPVPYAHLLEWTASADIGLTLFPPDYSLSIRWCLPNKLFEYIMAGVPVLTTELDAVVDIIKTYEIGQVVTSVTPEAFGGAINTMLADHIGLEHMRRNALNAARKELYWEKEQQNLIQLYYRVCETQKNYSNLDTALP